MLLQSGANIEARDQNGCTPLMFAVANGDEAVARSLLVSEARVDVQDFEGQMPLDYAPNFGYTKIADMIRTAGGKASALETQTDTKAQTSSECTNPFTSEGSDSTEAP